MKKQLKIDLRPVDLKAIILSHGWYSLEPLITRTDPPHLTIPFDLPTGKGLIEINPHNQKCEATVIKGPERVCKKVAETCLSLDFKKSILYKEIQKNPTWDWVAKRRMGRFLRSPTLFEDCCKALFATNTTFKRTKFMTSRTVGLYGAKLNEMKAFPGPEKLLKEGEQSIREKTACGYRAKYIMSLSSEAVKRPSFYLGSGWKKFETAKFCETLNKVTGIGPSSVNYISLIYNMPNGFCVDSYVRRRCKEEWGVGDNEINEFIKNRYKGIGKFAPTVFWFEITKHWLDSRHV